MFVFALIFPVINLVSATLLASLCPSISQSVFLRLPDHLEIRASPQT